QDTAVEVKRAATIGGIGVLVDDLRGLDETAVEVDHANARANADASGISTQTQAGTGGGAGEEQLCGARDIKGSGAGLTDDHPAAADDSVRAVADIELAIRTEVTSDHIKPSRDADGATGLVEGAGAGRTDLEIAAG